MNIKKQIRQNKIFERDNLDIKLRNIMDHDITKKIEQLNYYQKANKIAVYNAINSEVNLQFLTNSKTAQSKVIYFPKITSDKKLIFLPVIKNTKFSKNQFNILEPDVDIRFGVYPDQLDIIIMPMVAFDANGNRLGMGAGYYDRTLENQLPQKLMGVAYEMQYINNIPSDDWDIKVNIIITNKQIYNFNT